MTHPALIERITRSLAYMLRHQPEKFDLELDAYGFGDVNDVVRALNERLGEQVDIADLETAITSGDRPRYELRAGRVRALYGHSIDVEPGEPSQPPELLYVGIAARDGDRATQYGLRGGRRRFLHLALTPEDAKEAGRRSGREYAILTVYAMDAWEEGINFYDRQALFLAEEIPTEFLEISERCNDGFERPAFEEREASPHRRERGGARDRWEPRRPDTRGERPVQHAERSFERPQERAPERSPERQFERPAPRALDRAPGRPFEGSADRGPMAANGDERRGRRGRRGGRGRRPEPESMDSRPGEGAGPDASRPGRAPAAHGREREDSGRAWSDRIPAPPVTRPPPAPAHAPAAAQQAPRAQDEPRPASGAGRADVDRGTGFGLGIFEEPKPARTPAPAPPPPRKESAPRPTPERERARDESGPGFGAGV